MLVAFACTSERPADSKDDTSSEVGDGDGDPGDGDGDPGDGDGDPGDEIPELWSNQPHDGDPQLLPGELEALEAANHALTLDLYHALRNGQAAGEGFSISTYSIHSAFGMLYGGTTDPARTEIAQTLHFDLADDRQHVALNWLDAQFQSRNIPAVDDEIDAVEFATANAVWALDDLASGVSDAYLDLLALHYDVGVKLGDFDAQPEAEREVINDWVSTQTRDLIPELFPEGSIDTFTTLVLVNALYLKGPWYEPFSYTEAWDFTGLDNQVIPIEMMRNPGMSSAGFHVDPDYTIVDLPLRGNELELIVIMPEDFTAFEDSLDGAKLAAVLNSLDGGLLDLRMPMFNLEASFGLLEELEALGMVAPFSDVTSFDSIHEELNVIQTVVHKTVIRVDEDGLEAAAATGVGGDGDGDGDPPQPTVVVVDKPFLVAIRDRPTGTLLFFGRVLDPSL
ncbi:hypothetical protein DB30_06420 [Enhygromyxa salina]|uniref:Serpin domain-containing protein n=1 Tax=Enhygromyxa salina TaxID=215803 RepID=A0A0C1ZAP8_9BACT|nr:serpin family protein [Enhygromyxa salina]KIG14694.1 hypothetical protein DB30_06420 [Enhygromyxa salina]